MAGPWHILGAGSLGILWGVRLAEHGLPVSLILRDRKQLTAYQETRGITLIYPHGPVTCRVPAELAETETPVRKLVLACKAYDAVAAVRHLTGRIDDKTDILLLQNGLGSQDEIISVTPQARHIFAVTTEGAYRQAPFRAVFAGQGDIRLGNPAISSPPAWFEELATADLPVIWDSDISTRLWRKFAINCVINPLTVLYECRNGDLTTYLPCIETLCNELSALLTVYNQPVTPEDLFAEVCRIITATAGNYSSMYQDVAAGRRTENPYLLGYACRSGEQASLRLPLLSDLYTRVQAYFFRKGITD